MQKTLLLMLAVYRVVLGWGLTFVIAKQACGLSLVAGLTAPSLAWIAAGVRLGCEA